MKFPSSLARFLAAFTLTAFSRAEPHPQFLRASETPEKLSAIQTSSVEYRPASGTGPSVWLIGVAHLGTPEYYCAIQKRLDAHTVVLFEGVGMADQVKQAPADPSRDAGLQKLLSNALGLTFQLDAIDYRRSHFINSDLPVEGVQQKVEQRAAAISGGKPNETVAAVLEAIQGSPQAEQMLKPLMSFLTASPELRATTRLLLIEVLGRAAEFLDLAKSLSPEMKDLFEVLLTERNVIVLRDLRTQLAKLKPGQSVAIFYGAAHMPELAQRLRDELHYVPQPEQWDTAFTADPAKSSISREQLRMLIEMARMQMTPTGAGPK